MLIAGPKIHVNDDTVLIDQEPKITVLASGGWVVTWEAGRRSHDIYQQAYSADGSANGGETQVNSTWEGDQSEHQTTALSNGGWVVTWLSGQDGGGVYQQIYRADGSRQGGETLVNSNYYSNAVVTALAGSGWVLTWEGDGVHQQVYNADGSPVGSETRVDTTDEGYYYNHEVAALSDGGWVVTWQAWDEDFAADGFFQQAYHADGSALGGETHYDVIPVGKEVLALASGGWVVSWSPYDDSSDPYNNPTDFYQQAYNADGTLLGGEVRVNSTTRPNPGELHSVALADGGWVVTWETWTQSMAHEDIYQQAFHADGTPMGEETRVNSARRDSLEQGQIVALSDGGWMVMWQSWNDKKEGFDILVQAYNADASRRGGETLLASRAESYLDKSIGALPDGGWVMTWPSPGEEPVFPNPDEEYSDIYMRVFHMVTAADSLALTEDKSHSFAASDFRFSDLETRGSAGVTIVSVVSGSLKFDGEAASAGQFVKFRDLDQLSWSAGKDVIGKGLNAFIFTVTDPSGLGIDAGDPSYAIKFNVRDIVDRFTGTMKNDRLIGSDGEDVMSGRNGHDRLVGGRGDDWLTGGAGRDRFIFNAGDGKDRIMDFDATGKDHDIIGVHGVPYFPIYWHYYLHQEGKNVVIDAPDEIILMNVKLKDLDWSDFSV